MNRKRLSVQIRTLLQKTINNLNLSTQTAFNSLQILFNGALQNEDCQDCDIILATLYLSHKLFETNIFSVQKFATDITSSNRILQMETALLTKLKWKAYNILLIDQVLLLSEQWNIFTSQITVLGIAFHQQYSPTNLLILKQNTYRMAIIPKTYTFSKPRLAEAILVLTIQNSIKHLNKNQQFKPNQSTKFILNDFLQEIRSSSLQAIRQEISFVRKIIPNILTDITLDKDKAHRDKINKINKKTIKIHQFFQRKVANIVLNEK